MQMHADGAPRDGGFTLLEVLVAFAIAALALSVLANASVAGLTNATEAGRYMDALARARSHLAGLAWPPAPGDFEGEDGQGYHWHVRIVRGPTGNASRSGRVALYDIAVSISWDEGDRKRVVQLDTKRAAQVAASS